MKYILSIDQGTTGSRAVAYDKKGTIVAVAYEEFPQYFPRPGWVEHDPEEIFKSVYNAIQKVLRTICPGSIAAIGITNQRETTLMWDRQTGRPVCNAIVWQCRRTTQRCEALKKRGQSGFIRSRTGLPIDAYFSASKIEWILENVKGVRKKAAQGNICFGTPDTWILWKLSGGSVHATDYTNASRTMLFNIRQLQWDKQLLRLFSIPGSVLPKAQPSSGIFGKTCKMGRLPAGIPITGVAGDQQAALFGQACFLPGTMKNTYGTGAFMLLNTGKKMTISKHGLITTIACGPAGEAVYALEGSVFIAGAAIQWLRDGLKIVPRAAASEQMACSVPDNEGVYFVPALVGLGAPYWQPRARGLITGITRGTNQNHLARAALEAMCYQTKDIVAAMQRDSSLSVRELKVDGGAVSNDFLLQFQSDILQARIVRPRVIETTSLGAAYLAGLAAGFWKDTVEIMRYWKKDRVFSPRMPLREADRLYKGWKKAVQRTISVL